MAHHQYGNNLVGDQLTEDNGNPVHHPGTIGDYGTIGEDDGERAVRKMKELKKEQSHDDQNKTAATTTTTRAGVEHQGAADPGGGQIKVHTGSKSYAKGKGGLKW